LVASLGLRIGGCHLFDNDEAETRRHQFILNILRGGVPLKVSDECLQRLQDLLL